MRFVASTILLAFTGLIILVCTAVFSMTYGELSTVLQEQAVEHGIAGKVNHFLVTLETIGWICCVLMFAGAIVAYLVSSHYQEYEQYEDYGNRRF